MQSWSQIHYKQPSQRQPCKETAELVHYCSRSHRRNVPCSRELTSATQSSLMQISLKELLSLLHRYGPSRRACTPAAHFRGNTCCTLTQQLPHAIWVVSKRHGARCWMRRRKGTSNLESERLEYHITTHRLSGTGCGEAASLAPRSLRPPRPAPAPNYYLLSTNQHAMQHSRHSRCPQREATPTSVVHLNRYDYSKRES